MTVPVQIRHVPDETHEVLARAAARRGQSLQAYLLTVLEAEARALRNADLFFPLAPLRVEIGPEWAPEALTRADREAGYDAGRQEHSA